jgi:hypothetical protein
MNSDQHDGTSFEMDFVSWKSGSVLFGVRVAYPICDDIKMNNDIKMNKNDF